MYVVSFVAVYGQGVRYIGIVCLIEDIRGNNVALTILILQKFYTAWFLRW